jgi:hypothetical protein
MAQNFLTNIDLNGNQLQDGVLIRAIIENLATGTPSSASDGQLYYDSTTDTLYLRANGAWVSLVRGASSSTNAINVSVNSAGQIEISADDVVSNGDAGLMTGADKKKLDDATATSGTSTLVMRDASGRFQAVAPSADLDVANKSYVDGARSGLDVKDSVKLATNAALPTFTHLTGVLTASANAALALDGTTLTRGIDEGIRVLVKNETSGNAPYNGIYTVTDAGDGSNPWVLTRSTDADTDTEVTPGMFTFVEQGTNWADTGWVLSTDGAITVGTTALAWVQFSSAGVIIAGDGLVKTGNTIDVVGTTNRIAVTANAVDISDNYVGQSSITTLGTIVTGTWNGTDIAVADGGTGSSTASGARTNLADTTAGGLSTSTPVLSRISAQNCAGATTTTITHNFGTKDVIVQIYDINTDETVYADVVRTSTNVVTVTFASAPEADAYRIIVTG